MSLIVQDEDLVSSSLDNMQNLEELLIQQRQGYSHFADESMCSGLRLPKLRKLTLYVDEDVPCSDAAIRNCIGRGLEMRADRYLNRNLSPDTTSAFWRYLPTAKQVLLG